MAKRMSNKERIQRKSAEAEATAVEKEKKKAASKAAKPKAASARPVGTRREKHGAASASPATTRLKLVWKVFNANGKEVAVFPYPEKTEADAMAQKLSQKSGSPHFVNGVKVPLVSE